MNYKKFGKSLIVLFVISIIIIITTTIIVDPYFHFHGPLKKLNYIFYKDEQRYQNDGIVKRFDYDAVITGTSMTENFKASEFDELFNANSIKVPLSGAFFKETNNLLSNAFESNKEIRYVVRSIDYYIFYKDKDEYMYEYDMYPNYLYNDNIVDDIKYVINKKVFIKSISTLFNRKTSTFDEYSYWANDYEFGKKEIDRVYTRAEKLDQYKIKKKDIKILKDNINQNFISLIKKNPNTEFYLFYPPYSIYAWDNYNQVGELKKYLEGEKIVSELLLEYDNVHLFSFLDCYDIITNVDNYKDITHYNADVNSMILKSMATGKHELTKDNYKDYYDKIFEYYSNYDYDALF